MGRAAGMKSLSDALDATKRPRLLRRRLPRTWPTIRFYLISRHLQGLRTEGMTAPCLLIQSAGGVMDEPRQSIDGEKLDLPLNQEPGTAAPEFEINYEIEKEEEERGNRKPDELPSA
jgi:hypothetical protein